MRTNRKSLYVALGLVTFGLASSLVMVSAGAASAVGLGTADHFAILAGSTVTNTGATTISGDVGLSPGTSLTGFDTVTLVGSSQTYVANPVAVQAKSDLTTAYNVAVNLPCDFALSGDLGGRINPFVAGVYCYSSDALLTGTVVLQGDVDDVFIFQVGSQLTTAPASSVTLIGGVLSCNIFWQIGSSAILDTGTQFKGTIMALDSIRLNSAAVVMGRALAQTGEVTMNNNTISNEGCADASATSTTDADSTTSTTDSTTTTTDADTTTTDAGIAAETTTSTSTSTTTTTPAATTQPPAASTAPATGNPFLTATTTTSQPNMSPPPNASRSSTSGGGNSGGSIGGGGANVAGQSAVAPAPAPSGTASRAGVPAANLTGAGLTPAELPRTGGTLPTSIGLILGLWFLLAGKALIFTARKKTISVNS